MFLILTLALLPLGAVALFASLQAIRAADMEKDALLRIGVTQSARKLATDMLSDQSALRLAVNALADGSGGPGQCYRIGQFLTARAATAIEATEAYASIQRRVDALSVVHRNHFAELEENRGVGVRALVSELSASLRGTAPSDARRFAIQIDSDDLHVSQDVAVPVAFLLTELVELAMLAAPDTGMQISVRQTPDPARAQICVESPGLRGTLVTDHLHDRFDRVLTGLSRQLRSPMEKDDEIGRYCITIAVAL
jgi:hypothetical protein